MSRESAAFLAYSLQAMCFGLFLINAGRQRYDKRITFVCFALGVLGIQALFCVCTLGSIQDIHL